MSFLRSLFAKKGEEDYETVLSNLANEVEKRQIHLSEIRLRERRSTLVVTLYTLAAWIAYVSAWYMEFLPSLQGMQYVSSRGVERAIHTFPVIVGPILVLFIRRVVQIWYKRKGDAEEKALKELMKRRRDKVEEIKKKTNYYTTRDLLQKYDEPTQVGTPLRQRFPPGQIPATPQQRPLAPGTARPNQTPGPSAGLQAHLNPTTPSFPVAPPRKQWYDKLADAILGDDDPGFASPASRYALICEKCFAHNGLVREDMWEQSQYVCPKCGHFNMSVKAKRERQRQNLSANSTPNTSPQHNSHLSPGSHAGSASRSPSPSASPNVSIEHDADLPEVDGAETIPMDVDTSTDSIST
ncbi:hypothetical protein CVT24_007234 [Panaeolus cyanescens]|uniref:Endoplasmic reticulum junction formation protein lunapark n=1 Tax=Panaeolus cyanescens TaxID=181874 RepID=A0A409YPB7_9AGAR|nr:hypothetical protein CVT24_007234 [Panaeolus cyanescens]